MLLLGTVLTGCIPGPNFLRSLPVVTIHRYARSNILRTQDRDAPPAKSENSLQEQPEGSTTKEGCASQQHTGKMHLNLRMAAASLALLDECSDHCLESLAVTLHVSVPCIILQSWHFLQDELFCRWGLQFLARQYDLHPDGYIKVPVQEIDMHFGTSEETGITSGRMRAALEFTFLNSAVDANGRFHQCALPALPCKLSLSLCPM